MGMRILGWTFVACALSIQGCGGGRDVPIGQTDQGVAAARMTAAEQGIATFNHLRGSYRITTYGLTPVVAQRDGLAELPRDITGVHRLVFRDMAINLSIGALSTTIPRQDLNAIIELYIAFFNRLPDADGLEFWVTQFRGGTSIDRIADSFYEAALQYSNLTGYSRTMSNADFVRVVYKNVLGRDTVDQPALEFWSKRLDTGTSRGTLVTTILDSAHTFKNHPTFGWVANLLDNKLYVGHYFAVRQGINYLTPEESIIRTMTIAAAVTPAETFAATNMISRDAGFDLPTPITYDNDLGLTFLSWPLTGEAPAAYSGVVSMQVKVNRPFAPTTNIAIVDNGGVFNGQGWILPVSPGVVQVNLETAAPRAAGLHEGELEIHICYDDPLVCSEPQPGSPWKLPYRVILESQLSITHSPLNATIPAATVYEFPPVPIALSTGQSGLESSVTYSSGPFREWLSGSASGGFLRLKADTTGLPPGEYYAFFNVEAPGGQGRSLMVTVTVPR